MNVVPFVPFCRDVLGVELEPAQRVFWSVAADGVEPASFTGSDREIAREMFGDVDEIPAAARRHVAIIKGADVGFSYVGGLRLLHRALTAERNDAAPGEVRPALVVAPDLRIGRIPVRNALGAAERVPAIRALIDSSGADGFTIHRDGGWLTSVECLPASVGGRALRGRRYVEVLFDEAAFFRDATFSVNDVDCRRAVEPRCLGTFWNGSTPWLESADVWKTFTRNFGAPVDALAARLPTLLVRTDPRVVALVNAARERDPEGAATEYDCVPPAGSGGFFFDGFALDGCAVDTLPIELPFQAGALAVAGFDPAFQRDACAGVVVRTIDNGETFEVAAAWEKKPARDKPLVPSETVREFSAIATKHGAKCFASDIHYSQSVREHLGAGLTFVDAPGSNSGKAEVYGVARELIHAGRVKWSSGHRGLTQQLRDVIARPLPGGLISITSPRRKGAHGDVASAVCLALWLADREAKYGASPAQPPSFFGGGWTMNGWGDATL